MTNNLQNTTQKTKLRVYFCKYLSSNRMFYRMKFYKALVIAKISLLFFLVEETGEPGGNHRPVTSY
jgi:hypothetical protein